MKYWKKTDHVVRCPSFLRFWSLSAPGPLLLPRFIANIHIHASVLIRINSGTNFVREQCARPEFEFVHLSPQVTITKKLLACAHSVVVRIFNS